MHGDRSNEIGAGTKGLKSVFGNFLHTTAHKVESLRLDGLTQDWLLIVGSQSHCGSKGRTFKLAYGTTSEPGRYVKSLGGPVAGSSEEYEAPDAKPYFS